ncbi:Eco57I restriction-modification methylase domain-containing protein [Gloeomargaritales cyanobacterium VI4D9]|nr:Eco57I restriction-modification methylase domain-containing protein [Gloeomargaritales cyanobacterium VI4D9]
MTAQAPFTLRGRNPDVLTCIANLSSDEVFTPPEFANRMLDTLTEAWAQEHDGANLWANSEVRFLDPCTKSGVFLREITRRLVAGLKEQIPDLQARVNHILTRQVFGIGITRLTALMARRTVYCSKHAMGPHSICKEFQTDDGNIWFERVQHTWEGNKCRYCGAPRSELDRGEDRENYAYPFIHTDNIKARIAQMFGEAMQFDVIIGNPPYQLPSDGGTRDIPIYHHFVEQAKKLDPRYLIMVIPSRWMATGLGLSKFRQTILNDRRIRALVDFPNSKEVFPGVEVKGGICYFLWDASYDRDCQVQTIRNKEVIGPYWRNLGEFDIFVRDSQAVEILRKVLTHREPSVNTILARDKEFGWTSNFKGFHAREQPGDVPLNYICSGKRRVGYIARSEVKKSAHLINTWKVLVPEAGSDGGQKIPDIVLGKPMIVAPPSVCTQSFLFFFLKTKEEAQSLESYLRTRFFRFLVSLRKITQHATHSTYLWVPMQTWDRIWTDAELYQKYGLTQEEIDYIESVIRPMELNSEGNDN